MARIKETDDAICLTCRWCFGLGIGQAVCYAFPDGIPKRIWGGELGHDMVLPKQKGKFVWVALDDDIVDIKDMFDTPEELEKKAGR